jgi:hypothetical protein
VKAAATVLGLLLGAGLGARGGWLLGEWHAGWAEVSCFEGACGYAVAAWMLLGLVLGAALGPWLARRLLRGWCAGRGP